MILYIVRYFAIVIIQSVLILAFKDLVNKKIKISFKFALIVLLYSFIELFLSHYVSIPINGIICIIYFSLLMKYFLKLNFKETIFYILILWLMGIILDMAIMLLFNTIGVFIPVLDVTADYVKPVASLLMALCIILLVNNNYIQIGANNLYKFVNKINISTFKLLLLILCYLLLDVICIINIHNRYMIIILLGIMLLFTYNLFYRYEIVMLKTTNKILIHNNDFYIRLVNDYRIMKHNLINNLLGLKTVSNKKTKLLIDDLIKEYNSSFKEAKNVNDIPSGLNGIVFEKLYNIDCDSLNLTVDNKLNENIFNYLSAKSYNLLCEALGIALDNAIESAINSNDKILYLQFKEDKDCILIVLVNSFSGVLDLESLGKINYSSKINGHGFGLFTLFEKRKLNITTNIKNNLFRVEISINKKK